MRFNRRLGALLLVLFAALVQVAGDASVARADEKLSGAAGIFRALKIGQKISIVDKSGFGVEIHLLNDGKIGTHTVVELATNYIVVDDIVAVSRTWIPVSAIRSVVWMRVPDGGSALPR